MEMKEYHSKFLLIFFFFNFINVITYPVEMNLICDDFCLGILINGKEFPKGQLKPDLNTSLEYDKQNISFSANLNDTLTLSVKNGGGFGGISANITIGNLQYSTDMIDLWSMSDGVLQIAENNKGTLTIGDEIPNKKFTFNFTFPLYVKVYDDVRYKKINQEDNIFRIKYSIVNKEVSQNDILFVNFTKIPNKGVINYKSEKVQINKLYDISSQEYNFHYIFSEEPINEEAEYFIQNSTGILSNKAKITFISCSSNEDSSCNYSEQDSEGKCPKNYPYLLEDTSGCLKSCKEGQKVLYNKKCSFSCPNDYILYEGICIESNFFKGDEFKNKITINQPLEEFLYNLDDTLNLYKGLNKTIEAKNHTIEIVSTESKKKNPETSTINLGKCEDILKEHYKIKEVFIVKIDTKWEDSQLKQVNYLLYDENSNKLDLSHCKDENIQISYPLSNSMGLDIEEIKNKFQNGIDVLNPNEEVFNDICSSYSTQGSDVPIKDRRKEIFQSISVEEGCNILGYEPEENKIKCDCKTITKTSFEKAKTYVPLFKNELLDQTNLMIVTCFKLVTFQNLKKTNIGLWLFGMFMIIELLLIIFFFTQLRKFYSRLYQIQFGKLKSKEQLPEKTNLNFKLPIENKVNVHLENNTINSKNPFKVFFLVFISKFDLYEIFFDKNKFEILPLSLSFFFLSFILDFGFNAIFFTDNIISQKRKNGHLSIITKIILSFLSNCLGDIFFRLFQKIVNFSLVFKILQKEVSTEVEYFRKCKRLIKCIKIKLIFYFLLEFIISIFFLYFTFLFCIINPQSQYDWIVDCVTGIILSTFIIFSICVIVAILRSLSFCYKSQNLYYGSVLFERLG